MAKENKVARSILEFNECVGEVVDSFTYECNEKTLSLTPDTIAKMHSWAHINIKAILDRKEEILEAFIAKYGCGPEELEVVEERFDPLKNDGIIIKWYVQRRKQDV